MTNLDIIKQANQLLEGKRLIPIGVVILIMIFTGIPQNIDNKLSILSILISGPIGVGTAIFFLNFVRGYDARLEQLFDGFRQFIPSVILAVLTIIVVILGLVCLIVPGIILGLGLMFSTYVMADNPELSAMDVMRKSWDMTDGYKMKLFLFCLLSGCLVILGLLFFIIGIFYVMPIIYTATALFYEKLKDGTIEHSTDTI